MLFSESRISPAVIATKLLLMVASPFQSLFDRPGITHEFCNYQALIIMHNDGLSQSARFINRYRKELNAGVFWADKGWKNASHYFEPTSGKGLWHFANAFTDFQSYYRHAEEHMRIMDFDKAVFFLGAAVHLMQDLCVPHHARAKLFCGHKEFEAWVQEHCTDYAVRESGSYHTHDNLSDRLYENAVAAADLFDWVNLEQGAIRYHEATEILLPLAQRSTAGLFQTFCANFVTLINADLSQPRKSGAEATSEAKLDEEWQVAIVKTRGQGIALLEQSPCPLCFP